jgi:hypothetical protein
VCMYWIDIQRKHASNSLAGWCVSVCVRVCMCVYMCCLCMLYACVGHHEGYR